MRTTTLPALGLVTALALPASAVGTPGPFAGYMRQDDVRTHQYDNNPTRQPCIQIVTHYTVTLSYQPPGDVLTLSVGSYTATGSNGRAAVGFLASACTAFTITVRGTSVADTALYTVSVTGGSNTSS